MMGSLDNGVDKMGAVTKSHDKNGKRMHTCSPTDMTKQHEQVAAPRKIA